MRRVTLRLVIFLNVMAGLSAYSGGTPSYVLPREAQVTPELRHEVESTAVVVALGPKRSPLAMKAVQDGYTAAAVVDMILDVRPGVPAQDVLEIAFAIARWTRNTGIRPDGKPKVRPEVMVALIDHESGFNPNAASPTNDHGLTQLHGRPVYDIGRNIELGVMHLLGCLITAGGNEQRALACYNGGGSPPPASFRYADAILGKANALAGSTGNAAPEQF